MAYRVCVTGFGLVSPLGSTEPECWTALCQGSPRAVRHPILGGVFCPLDESGLDQHVTRAADRRQMGPMMRYAVEAASEALEMAGVTGASSLRSKLRVYVAAGTGERDMVQDEAALRACSASEWSARELNRCLLGLRPSHFLTQLPSLVASNVCIVSKIAAPCRTFIGGEIAGVNAMRAAWAEIREGRGDIYLVGGAQNADSIQVLLPYAAAGCLRFEPYGSVWEPESDGFVLGSIGAFLVLEEEEHARARGVTVLAYLDELQSSIGERESVGDIHQRAASVRAGLDSNDTVCVISGVAGTRDAAAYEKRFLEALTGCALNVTVRAPSRVQGHSVEPAFIANCILAVFCLGRREVFPPVDPSRYERPDGRALERILVTAINTIGPGEGAACLSVAV
jgi:3-oxoacyl-[acyl-carrier-protein] synthase II